MEEKFICLIAMFDEDTNKKFKLINDELKKNGLSDTSLTPHITLAAYEGVEEKELCDYIEKICSENGKVEINFNHMGLFSLEVAFLAPQVSKDLTELHCKVHEKYEDKCGEVGFKYTVKSKSWVPHATIIIDDNEEKILKSLPIINKNFEPFKGKIVSLGLYEFYPMREIKVLKFMK